MESGKKRKIIAIFLYLIIAIILVFSLILIWPVHRKYKKMKGYVDSLQEDYSQKNDECARLNKDVHDLSHNPTAVEKVAREKFELCREGEVILKYDKKKSK